MRLKLLIIVSLVAAAIGSGASIIEIIVISRYWAELLDQNLSAHAWSIALIDVPPLCTALLASVFIYRHTARRRKIQAALTAIVVLLLCVLALIAVSRYFFYSQLSH